MQKVQIMKLIMPPVTPNVFYLCQSMPPFAIYFLPVML